MNEENIYPLQLANQCYGGMKNLIESGVLEGVLEEFVLLKTHVEILVIKSGSNFSEVKQLADSGEIVMPDKSVFTIDNPAKLMRNLNKTFRQLYFTSLFQALEKILCFEKRRLNAVDNLSSYAFCQLIRLTRNANSHVNNKIEFKGAALKMNADKWIDVFNHLEIDELKISELKLKDDSLREYSYSFSPSAYGAIIVGLINEIQRLFESNSPLLREEPSIHQC